MIQGTIMCYNFSLTKHELFIFAFFFYETFIVYITVQLLWDSGELLAISAPSTLSTCSNLCLCWISCLYCSASLLDVYLFSIRHKVFL